MSPAHVPVRRDHRLHQERGRRSTGGLVPRAEREGRRTGERVAEIGRVGVGLQRVRQVEAVVTGVAHEVAVEGQRIDHTACDETVRGRRDEDGGRSACAPGTRIASPAKRTKAKV
ncbi:MAG: hypothetical protein P8R42_25005 [Candidatus Binatia bacterium]|nr:hypothetical protein [Candidatus Binatia bacterium]